MGAIEYVRGLEEVLIRTCADFGIATGRICGLTGVWTAPDQGTIPSGPNPAEGKIAALLDACLERFPKLLLGSYPKIGNSEYRVKVTLESKDRDYLENAFARLMELLPRDAVVKIE